MNQSNTPWKVSLHGGHSGEFCDHATGTLREVVEAAIAADFLTYGISEHVPRLGERYLYDNEIHLGWTVEKIAADFEAYGKAVFDVADEFSDRITILRGYEIEVVPPDSYVEKMLAFRDRFRFDYMIGSVHYVHDYSIDGVTSEFEKALAQSGSLEQLAIDYYRAVAEMVAALKPEVVGHLDLIRKNGHLLGQTDTKTIRRVVNDTLDVIRQHECILDLNTAGWRKGLDSPYPAPWLVQRATDMGIPFCFGDDSHGPELVGAGIHEAREYLLQNGVTTVTVLGREGNEVLRRAVSLG